MEAEEVPVLTLQHIDELSAMVRGIQKDNRRQLDQIISSTVDIQYTTIISTISYNQIFTTWPSSNGIINKKQLIISATSHVITLQLSEYDEYYPTPLGKEILARGQNQQCRNSDRFSREKCRLSECTNESTKEQNQNFKAKINQAEVQLSNLNEQKDRIEQLYRSSSCIAFQREVSLQQIQHMGKKCSACYDTQSQCEQQKNQAQQLSLKVMEQKQSQINSLKQQNRKLQEEYEQLKEENQLNKIQMELAQIAVKEALVYKSSYISMMSSLNQNNPEHLQEDRSQHSQNKNQKRDLESHQLCPLDSHLLAFDLPKNQEPSEVVDHHYIQNSREDDSCQLSLIKLQTKVQQKETTYRSPFRKKGANCPQSQNEHQESFQQSAIQNKKDIIIFQSNIDFTLSSVHSNSKQKSFSEIHPSRTLHPPRQYSRNPNKIKPVNMKRQRKPLANNQVQHQSTPFIRPRPYVPSEHNIQSRVNESGESETSQNTINKLYNYFSSKLITNRIRRKK